MLMQKWMAHPPRREERPLALRRLFLLPLFALAIWELPGRIDGALIRDLRRKRVEPVQRVASTWIQAYVHGSVTLRSRAK